jgi:hypothetical protein
MTGPLGRDHKDIEIGSRLDQIEVNVETMCEEQSGALLHFVFQMIVVDIGLKLVGRHHHQGIAPFCGLGNRHDRQSRLFSLAGRT